MRNLLATISATSIRVASRPTASYTAILDPNGELVLGLAEMDLYEEITPAVLQPSLPRLRECELWFVDANLPAETIERLASFDAHLTADAISVVKSRRLRGVLDRHAVVFLSLAQAGSSADEPFDDPCCRRDGSARRHRDRGRVRHSGVVRRQGASDASASRHSA